jgi:hypothetical protein
MPRYPEQIDCVWLASDQDGHAAAFVTAGLGPIPTRALDLTEPPFDELEELVSAAAACSEVEMRVHVPRPDSFIALASRGLFVFDWTDIHKTRASSLDAYELVARPKQPAHADALPQLLRQACLSVTISGVAFSETALISPRELGEVATSSLA